MTSFVDVTAPPTLTPAQAHAVSVLARHLGPALASATSSAVGASGHVGAGAGGGAHGESILDFGSRTFYVPETGYPIQFMPHQRLILELMFNPMYAFQLGVPNGWQTLVFSTVKKSGKTTIAALAARWVAETWGKFNEVYSIANDKEQSRGRVYAKALQSIQLDPRFVRASGGSGDIPHYWRIIEREATHLPSGSYLRAVSNDYKGEAGANPTATFWSELWGYTLEASRRLWDELTPVPTRPRSIRFVETYAGFEGESTLLIKLYEMVTHPDRGARRITREDLATLDPPLVWPFPPDHDPELPLYINPSARSIAYWDSSPRARRMPWQTADYYAAQAIEMRPEVFDRLHNNEWVSAVSTFIPKEWYTACRPSPQDPPLPPLDPREPMVLAADASVSGDCTGLVGVTRYPDPNWRKEFSVARLAHLWTPKPGHPMNYGEPGGLKEKVRELVSKYNIVEFAYDPYQLHDFATTLRDEGIVWTRPFGQGEPRMVADFGLYTAIRDRKIIDDTGSSDLATHVGQAGARIPVNDNSKLRIVKKSEDSKIDLAVALSMARAECLRLNLD